MTDVNNAAQSATEAQTSQRAVPFSRARFRSSRESEARLLLLIDTFSRMSSGDVRYLEGRVKLAKLDFLLRYPRHLRRILLSHGATVKAVSTIDPDEAPLDARMMRYRYGPWDPAYYAILGSLIGRGLVEVAPLTSTSGYGYRTSATGATLATSLRTDESFTRLTNRLVLLRRYLDKSGTTLKRYLYELPEIANATWREDIT